AAPRRALHSFPTRRSSDLGIGEGHRNDDQRRQGEIDHDDGAESIKPDPGAMGDAGDAGGTPHDLPPMNRTIRAASASTALDRTSRTMPSAAATPQLACSDTVFSSCWAIMMIRPPPRIAGVT